MGCFDNIISIRGGCDVVTPTSGWYLDDIDLYRSEVEQFIEKPWNDADSFITAKINTSVKSVTDVLYNEYRERYLSTTIINGSRLGYPQENLQLQTGSSNQRGITIELCNESSFVDLYISEMSLFLDTNGVKNIVVYDLIENKLLDTLPVTTVAGNQVTIYPHKTYKSNRKKLQLFIGYDSTGSNSYLTSFTSEGCFSCGTNGYKNAWVSVNGAEFTSAETKIISNVTGLSHTSGLSIMYSINCNHTEWLCANAGQLAMPILYRTAADIMNYGLEVTQRFNSRTNLDVEDMKKRRDFFDFKYHETLRSVLGRMRLPQDRVCFICNDRARVSYAM